MKQNMNKNRIKSKPKSKSKKTRKQKRRQRKHVKHTGGSDSGYIYSEIQPAVYSNIINPPPIYKKVIYGAYSHEIETLKYEDLIEKLVSIIDVIEKHPKGPDCLDLVLSSIFSGYTPISNYDIIKMLSPSELGEQITEFKSRISNQEYQQNNSDYVEMINLLSAMETRYKYLQTLGKLGDEDDQVSKQVLESIETAKETHQIRHVIDISMFDEIQQLCGNEILNLIIIMLRYLKFELDIVANVLECKTRWNINMTPENIFVQPLLAAMTTKASKELNNAIRDENYAIIVHLYDKLEKLKARFSNAYETGLCHATGFCKFIWNNSKDYQNILSNNIVKNSQDITYIDS
tara:strand:+ start:77 stop:1117 length:1041 start_codon:yes stop_codon:yes gene_type:complete